VFIKTDVTIDYGVVTPGGHSFGWTTAEAVVRAVDGWDFMSRAERSQCRIVKTTTIVVTEEVTA
jgi:hypothetical protein